MTELLDIEASLTSDSPEEECIFRAGYKPINGKYLKRFGFLLLVIQKSSEVYTLSFLFKAATDEVRVWDSVKLDSEDLFRDILAAENGGFKRLTIYRVIE